VASEVIFTAGGGHDATPPSNAWKSGQIVSLIKSRASRWTKGSRRSRIEPTRWTRRSRPRRRRLLKIAAPRARCPWVDGCLIGAEGEGTSRPQVTLCYKGAG